MEKNYLPPTAWETARVLAGLSREPGEYGFENESVIAVALCPPPAEDCDFVFNGFLTKVAEINEENAKAGRKRMWVNERATETFGHLAAVFISGVAIFNLYHTEHPVLSLHRPPCTFPPSPTALGSPSFTFLFGGGGWRWRGWLAVSLPVALAVRWRRRSRLHIPFSFRPFRHLQAWQQHKSEPYFKKTNFKEYCIRLGSFLEMHRSAQKAVPSSFLPSARPFFRPCCS